MDQSQKVKIRALFATGQYTRLILAQMFGTDFATVKAIVGGLANG